LDLENLNVAKNSKGTAKGSRPGYARAGSQAQAPARRGAGFWALLAGGMALATIVVAIAVSSLSGGGSTGWVEKGNGGTWTNVDANQLADMMKTRDFTLLNVKTPYIGEIEGTNLYIPYDQLTARAAELPTDKTAKVVVYCRAGNESRVAIQTLIDLGYTNIWNLDKGMESWTASGRALVQKSRT
jgi:phage shock protein E